MINLAAIITVEFSLSQKCFHITTLDEVLLSNAQNVLMRTQSDYVLIGVAKTYPEADQVVEFYRGRMKIDDYKIYRDTAGRQIVT